jgi:hypothetical protein
MGGKTGRAPIRKSLSGELRHRIRFRAGLRGVKVTKLWFETADESFRCKRPQVEH